jgi:hypothetical protein
MNLEEVGGGCGDWMERAQDRDRWRTLVNTLMNWMERAQDRDRWRTLVSTVMNFRVP